MSSNYIQPGDTLTLTAPYTCTAGHGALVGTALFGIAEQDVLIAVEGEFSVVGVFDIAKGVATVDAFSVGDLAYWDDTNHQATPTDSDGVEIGVCVKDAVAADTTVRVRLNGIAAK